MRDSSSSIPRRLPLLILGVFALLCCWIVFHYGMVDAETKIGWIGWGPQSYVWQKFFPENFAKDWWPQGMNTYDLSLCMRPYLWAYRWAGVDPSDFMRVYVFAEILLFSAALFTLCLKLSGNAFTAFACLLAAFLSPLMGVNLGRFGAGMLSFMDDPSLSSLFYLYAYAFSLLALAAFFSGRPIAAFLFAALCAYCHANIGLFCLLFLAGGILFTPRLLLDRRLWIGAALCALLLLPHAASLFSSGASPMTAQDNADWIRVTRIFSYHWYPVRLNTLSLSAPGHLYQVLLVCLLLFVSLAVRPTGDRTEQKIAGGVFVCFVLAAAGVWFSDFRPLPTVIKISAPRALDLVTLLGVVCGIRYFCARLTEPRLFPSLVSAWALAAFFFTSPGAALAPVLLLSFDDVRRGGSLGPLSLPRAARIAALAVLGAALAFFLFLASCFFLQTLRPGSCAAFSDFCQSAPLFKSFNPFSPGGDFLVRGGHLRFPAPFWLLLLSGSGLWAAPRLLPLIKTPAAAPVLGALLLGAAGALGVFLPRAEALDQWRRNPHAELFRAYYDTQLWARDHTPADALFLVDPSLYNGWRDFSRRSKFGSVREWGFGTVAYAYNRAVLSEGKRRLLEFGVDLDAPGLDDVSALEKKYFTRGDELTYRVRDRFYAMTRDELLALCRGYGARYLVMRTGRDGHTARFKDLPAVYENSHFIVYEVP